MNKVYLGIDVGAATTKLAVLGEADELVDSVYLPTAGQPIAALQQAMRQARRSLPGTAEVGGVATTGSGRYLAGVMVGADMVKNEITCHAAGALHYVPQARTILEIGGQDSKIIIIKEGVVADFAMNTVCAAGTGSFLEHQAQRLGLGRGEFARRALASRRPVHIAGRCTVFAESDMVHKQQTGHRLEDIAYGLCRALVRNYLGNVAAGKDIRPPVVFQGGVAFQPGMVRAFQEELGGEIIVPPHHELMGAIGVALLVREEIEAGRQSSRFGGFDISETKYDVSPLECKACDNRCEIERLAVNGKVLAHWGGRCDLWEKSPV